MGDEARRFLKPGARMVWTVEAENHCEAMTKYYEHMGYGMYRPQRESDCDPYPSEWLTIQASDKKKA
jgi:hypothetical protein